MEHVSSPEKYIQECHRVLKPNGVALFETCPVWTGARGHHIHEDMVQRKCPEDAWYQNDGSVVPDWGHLRLDESAMRAALSARLKPATVDYVVWYMNRGSDLNRMGWRRMRGFFEARFAQVDIRTWKAPGAADADRPTDGQDDYDVYGFTLTARKRALGPWTATLIRALRRIGL